MAGSFYVLNVALSLVSSVNPAVTNCKDVRSTDENKRKKMEAEKKYYLRKYVGL